MTEVTVLLPVGVALAIGGATLYGSLRLWQALAEASGAVRSRDR